MQGNIASWKKKEGEEFAAGDVLAEIETDKVKFVCLRPDIVLHLAVLSTPLRQGCVAAACTANYAGMPTQPFILIMPGVARWSCHSHATAILRYSVPVNVSDACFGCAGYHGLGGPGRGSYSKDSGG